MKKTFAAIALSAACLLLAGCEKESDANGDDPGKYNVTYVVTEILYAASAEREGVADEIEADMQERKYPRLHIAPTHDFCSFSESMGEKWGSGEMICGTLVAGHVGDLPAALSLLTPRTPIVSVDKVIVDNDVVGSVYYIYVKHEKKQSTRASFSFDDLDMWRYEDLTEHYKGLYPEAGVSGAVRVMISKPLGSFSDLPKDS